MIPWYHVNFADEDPSGFAAARRGHLKPEVGQFWKIKQPKQGSMIYAVGYEEKFPFLILCRKKKEEGDFLWDCQCLGPSGQILRRFIDLIYYEPC